MTDPRILHMEATGETPQQTRLRLAERPRSWIVAATVQLTWRTEEEPQSLDEAKRFARLQLDLCDWASQCNSVLESVEVEEDS